MPGSVEKNGKVPNIIAITQRSHFRNIQNKAKRANLPQSIRKLTLSEKLHTALYYYPQYDDTLITAEVPSQELSDAMVKAFKGKIKE